MEKFQTVRSTMVPLNVEDIDTDQIIPARFLKTTTREGFGSNLFFDWRYDSKNQINKKFILNDLSATGKILIAGKNFGCGSSREHAAWALYDYGFRVVISSFFADIFKSNALNNGILPIQVTQKTLNRLFDFIGKIQELEMTVSLVDQTIKISSVNLIERFEINAYKRECLLNGHDDIDYLLSIKNKIISYEQKSKHLSFIK